MSYLSWPIIPGQSSAFAANMEQALDVYKLAFNEDYPVVCMNESPKQMIEDIASTQI